MSNDFLSEVGDGFLPLDSEGKKVAEGVVKTFNDLTKDLPSETKSVLAGVILGGAVLAAGVAIGIALSKK